jgi:hypothetical protein
MLRKEHRLRVHENRVLRITFVPKRDEVSGEWRKLHSEKLHILYSSTNIIRQMKSRRMTWAGNVARMGEGRNVYRVLMRKLEGKRPLRRPRRRWKDGIRIDLRETGWEDAEWVQLAQNRGLWRALVNAVINLRVLAPRIDFLKRRCHRPGLNPRTLGPMEGTLAITQPRMTLYARHEKMYIRRHHQQNSYSTVAVGLLLIRSVKKRFVCINERA